MSTDPIVEFLARFCAVDDLLARHADDGTGHCVGCIEQQQGVRYRWPCTLHHYATRAADEVERRRGC